jgi:endonuclease/exonuclease/phosphatase family metal-dependent hydrolase
VDSAVAVLLSEPDLVDADVVLLQEMDEAGAQRTADALGMGYVYYPAMLSRSTGRHFGNAVLSRWPILSDEKLVLPHLAVFGQTQRIAVIATIQVGGRRLRVYSVHLATAMDQAERDRRDQMRAILDDAGLHPYVVIGGDLNSQGLAAMAEERGFTWPTREGPWTAPVGRLDHIVFRGLVPPATAASGTVEDNRGASDHRPVWAVGVIP